MPEGKRTCRGVDAAILPSNQILSIGSSCYLLASLIRASNRAGTRWQHSGGNLWSLINQMCPQTVGRTTGTGENPLIHQENMQKPQSVGKSLPAVSGRSFKWKSDAFIQPGNGALSGICSCYYRPCHVLLGLPILQNYGHACSSIPHKSRAR